MTGRSIRSLAAGESALAETRLRRCKSIFGDRLYVAVERHGMEVERQAEAGVVDLAYRLDLPLVATNEPFFPKRRGFRGARRAACHRGGAASFQPTTAGG